MRPNCIVSGAHICASSRISRVHINFVCDLPERANGIGRHTANVTRLCNIQREPFSHLVHDDRVELTKLEYTLGTEAPGCESLESFLHRYSSQL